MSPLRLVQRALRRLGIEVARHREPFNIQRRRRLLALSGTTLVLDVGASTGQFARHLREELGWRGRIVSFEPLPDAFAELARAAAADPAWEAVNAALGDEEGAAELHVAGNSWSSSLRPMLPAHEEAAPESRYVGAETVALRRLDSVFGAHARPDDRVWLKMDTQGYERNVLEGARESLPRIAVVQMEVEFVPLYAGETLFPEMHAWMEARGYRLWHLEPGWIDPATEALFGVEAFYLRAGDEHSLAAGLDARARTR